VYLPRSVFTRLTAVLPVSLVGFAALSALSGCVVGDASPVAEGDDDGTPQGPGPGPDPGSDPSPTPRVAVTADRTSISTELATSNTVTLTLKASGGFAGTATLTASAVDTAGAPITAWNITLDKPTIELASDATATAVATVKVPSAVNALSGMVKIDATTSLGTITTQATVTVAKQITYAMTLNGAKCIYPVAAGSQTAISQGTKVRWVNNDPANRITIHIGAVGGKAITGFDHEPDPGMAPAGGTFEQTAQSTTGAVDWYCHNRDNSQGIQLKAAP
jgi:hypothetical protein